MSKRIGALFAAAAACLAAGAAMAQQAPAKAAESPAPAASSTTVAPVTVTSPKQSVIEKQSYAFVKSHVAPDQPEIGQFGRWRDPVCVEVVGLPLEDQAAAIKARIESVAQAVGVPKADPHCTANVEIVFSDEPQKVMDLVAERREYLLGYWHVHLRDQLKRVTHPIQSWYVTATEAEGSADAAMAFNGLSQFVENPRAKVIDDPWQRPPAGCAASHFTSCLTSELDNVFIVADSKALSGKNLGTVADYMVMLALSRPRTLDSCNALDSVLDLFAMPSCPSQKEPDGLTPADAAYLTALYQSDLRAKALGEKGEISLRMSRMLLNASAAKH
jgi:hypothetical protein